MIPHWVDIIARVVLICSLLTSALPPWESFAAYPGFQKWYKFLLIFVYRFGALNIKSMLYPGLKPIAQTILLETPTAIGGPLPPGTKDTKA